MLLLYLRERGGAGLRDDGIEKMHPYKNRRKKREKEKKIPFALNVNGAPLLLYASAGSFFIF